jgi:hypothetical protein
VVPDVVPVVPVATDGVSVEKRLAQFEEVWKREREEVWPTYINRALTIAH